MRKGGYAPKYLFPLIYMESLFRQSLSKHSCRKRPVPGGKSAPVPVQERIIHENIGDLRDQARGHKVSAGHSGTSDYTGDGMPRMRDRAAQGDA